MNRLVRPARLFLARTAAPQRTRMLGYPKRSLSSVAFSQDEDYSTFTERHCPSCTCHDVNGIVLDEENTVSQDTLSDATLHPCGHEEEEQDLPPPLPQPTYSVHKRVLPQNLIALSSKQGRKMLVDALSSGNAESYWSLIQHFSNQSDPAYCGITTLLIVLNSFSVDPNIRWRGGWRYFGNEDTLLQKCCISRERIQRAGINMNEFARLAKCQGLQVEMKQLDEYTTVDEFRNDLQTTLSNENGIVVTSFARSALGQTGEGHFSPIAALYEDYALVLDVARFKYAPYWVTISDLYEAMKPLDESSGKPRGWFVLHPPAHSVGSDVGEARRPAHLVPEATESDICPLGKIKVEYCEARLPPS